jgi:hypothetical protein
MTGGIIMGLSAKEMTAGMKAALDKVTSTVQSALTPSTTAPSSKALGSGMAAKAGKAIQDRKKANDDALNY